MERLLDARNKAPLPHRAVRTARVCRGAWKQKRDNERLNEPTARHADQEFRDFAWAGMHLEQLFGRSEWIANRLAERLL
jgi:hypothetical protein